MDVLSDWRDYYRLNISLLSVIGLWPYGNKFVLRLKRFLGSFFVLLFCFSQFATFFTMNYTRSILLKNVPYIFVACGALVKYISFLVAGNSIKRTMEGIHGDRKAVSSKEEIGIMKKYVERGKFHTKGFAMFIFPLVLCLVLSSLSSVILETAMPLNQTRSYSFPFTFELFVDQKKHWFLVAFLFDGMCIVTGFVFVSTETLLIVYVQHACALFEVTSYRIKKLLCASGTSDSKNCNNLVMIADVVSIHCRAIRYFKLLREDFFTSYLMLLVFGILSLGAYIFRCIQTFASHQFTECLTSTMFCIAILGYMFYMNFVMQNVLDLSGNIFSNLYNTAWYNGPITTQKLILSCMTNCVKPVAIDVCGLFAPGHKGFSMIARTSMSYATALYSLQ